MLTKTCRKCLKKMPISSFYKNKTYREGIVPKCKTCCNNYERIRKRTWYKSKNIEVQKSFKRRRKLQLIRAYGGKCTCCGETHFELLQIDHVNGGGRQHRKRLTIHMSAHLRKLGYPKKGYRLLCSNCNSSLGLYGYCPHKNEDRH